MLTINDVMPNFKKLSNLSLDTEIDNAFPEVEYKVTESGSELTFSEQGSEKESKKNEWLVVFAYPKDFTFICPTEIVAFGDLYEDFQDRDTNVLAFSN